MGSDAREKASKARQTEIARIELCQKTIPYICAALFAYWIYAVFPMLGDAAPLSLQGWE